MKSIADKEILLEESFEGGLKYSLYSNFKNWNEAFLELLDNAVSNRLPSELLKVEIYTSPKHFRIVNRGGYGMGLKQLQEFLQWGKIKERSSYDLGAYSQGGKAAMGYLGSQMIVTASPKGENKHYEIQDDNLHDYKLKKYKVTTRELPNLTGYVEVEVKGLRRKIKNEEIVALVQNVYRPLIETREVIFSINTEEIKTKNFPLDTSAPVKNFSFKVNRGNKYHKEVHGWLSRLVSRSGFKGGMRCYKLGRLISEREFFGHPDANYKQSLNFLFGEVHLDHVPATTNKTDFDRDSLQWLEVKERMYEVLKSDVEELLGRDIQEPTEEEKERVQKAKELVDELLRMKKIDLKGVPAENFYSEGQKPKEYGDGVHSKNRSSAQRKNNPATPPPLDASGKRKRLKEFLKWDIRPMDEVVRSLVEEKDERKLLVINNLFPGFVAAKGHLLYLLETAAIQLSKPDDDEKVSPDEYLRRFDELYSFFCSNLTRAKEVLESKKTKLE